MYLIVGLGNPGKEYENTRHNMGFHFLDCFAKENNIEINKEKFHGLYGEGRIDNEKVILLKPQQYMNLSGEAVKKFVDYFEIDLDHLLIIHDDLDLPLGTFRLRKQGSSGGHNGLKDIARLLNTEAYKRLKLGISNNKAIDTKDYVLSTFSKEEQQEIAELEKTIIQLLTDFLKDDFETLMSKYNHK